MTQRSAVRFRIPERGDAEALASNLRADDAAECRAMGHTGIDALRAGLAGSDGPIIVEGRKPGRSSTVGFLPAYEPICALGVVPVSLMDGVARPWMLGTCEVGAHVREIVTYGPAFIASWRRRWRTLENHVGAENRLAIRLIEWLGFSISPETVYFGGVAFRRFALEG